MKIVVAPPCPVCGSKKTGYFITGNDPELKEKYFLRGERIRLRPVPNGKNCFCINCGMEWRGSLSKKHFSKEEFENYLIEQGFKEQRDQYIERRGSQKKELSDEEKEKRKEKRKTIFRIVLLAFTGIDIKRRKNDNDSE